jgi:hypothetical protein
MPAVYAEVHDEILRRFVSHVSDEYSLKERNLVALTGEGYIVPVTIMSKLQTSPEHGV